MSAIAAFIILGTTLVTSFISGIFGMAGGIILMAVLVALVSVAMAMIIHGGIQMFANGYRAFLLRVSTAWRVLGYSCTRAAARFTVLPCAHSGVPALMGTYLPQCQIFGQVRGAIGPRQIARGVILSHAMRHKGTKP